MFPWNVDPWRPKGSDTDIYQQGTTKYDALVHTLGSSEAVFTWYRRPSALDTDEWPHKPPTLFLETQPVTLLTIPLPPGQGLARGKRRHTSDTPDVTMAPVEADLGHPP